VGEEGQYVTVDVSQELCLSGDKSFNLDTLWAIIEKKLRQEQGGKFEKIVNIRISKEHEADIRVSPRSEDLRPADKGNSSKKTVSPLGKLGKF
jgi:hypothetical protein